MIPGVQRKSGRYPPYHLTYVVNKILPQELSNRAVNKILTYAQLPTLRKANIERRPYQVVAIKEEDRKRVPNVFKQVGCNSSSVPSNDLNDIKNTLQSISETQTNELDSIKNTLQSMKENSKNTSNAINDLSQHLLQEQILNKIIKKKDYEILQLKNIIHQLHYERGTDFQG